MLGIIYLIFCFWIGYESIKKFLPGIHKISQVEVFAGKSVLCNWMVSLPASFLTGCVFCTWLTYLAACAFSSAEKPLFGANIFSFSIFILIILFILVYERRIPEKEYVQQESGKWTRCFFEIVFLFLLTLFWGWFLLESLHREGGRVLTGSSVYGDFGVHLGFIRSFSWGSNFPAEHPHFAGIPMHKHFLLQFLAGNLNYLGIPIDWAYNLPSLLSFMAFIMLLYSLAVMLTGERAVGVLVSIMVLCRSAFAIFYFLQEFDSVGAFFRELFSFKTFIGRTIYDNWGIWTPNAHLNQRHFSFGLGVLVLVVIALIPLAKKMLSAVRQRKVEGERRYAAGLMRETFLKKDAWLPREYGSALFLGTLLGLSGFFNSAIVLGTVLVLAGLSLFSKNRLTYFIIIALTAILMLAEAKFITGSSGSPVAILVKIGFLAPRPDLISIAKYYIELMGVLPFVVTAGICFAVPGTRRLALAFLLPLIFVNFIQLSIKPHDGHKLAHISIYLLNIFAAFFVVSLYKGKLNIWKPRFRHGDSAIEGRPLSFIRQGLRYIRRGSRKFVAIIIFLLLTVSGMLDLIIVYNKQQNTYGYDPAMTQWIARNTDPKGIFLGPPFVAHPILFAGRKLFLGRPYYVTFLGYDTDKREKIVKEIFGGQDISTVKRLLHEHNIKYIVIDRYLRKLEDYSVNEKLFEEHFPLIYHKSGTDIYKVN